VIYRVELTPTAEAELWDDFLYIHERAPLNAQQWLVSVYEAIDTLESFPRRCAVAPEGQYVEDELRHLLFKSHRIIFHIDEPQKVVRILHIRRGSRRAIGEQPDAGD
jgi:plasmid stabilization system protein ParE